MMYKIARMLTIVFAFALLTLSATILFAQDETPTTVACRLPFRAAVLIGPSTGTTLEGELVFIVNATGDLMGRLEMNDDSMVDVFGHVSGRSVGLVFELEAQSEASAGSYIFGTGITRDPILGGTNCGGALGGTFTGPQEPDLGSWAGFCVTLRTFDPDNDPSIQDLIDAGDPTFGTVESETFCELPSPPDIELTPTPSS